MDYISMFREKAKQLQKTIILPEAEEDERILSAAMQIKKLGLGRVILLGNPDTIRLIAKNIPADISGIEIVDHVDSPEFDKYADQYFELRKHKGLSAEEAKIAMRNPLYYAPLMLKNKIGDAVVAGAANATADVLRGALRVLGTAEGIKTVSSFFIMVTDKPEFGEKGTLIFADCAILPEPNAQQLADIAIMTAENTKKLLDIEPKVAMLAFSTKGSAEHENLEKINKAIEIAHKNKPDLIIDGELQADAAIIPKVAKKKAPGSKIQGNANILIFPDLNAGNISYKLVQRVAGAQAIGPIIQGLKQPVNDLSRGCSIDDIINVACIASIMS